MPPEEVYKFYGVDINEADDVVKQEALKRTQQKELNASGSGEEKHGQNYEDALRVFYGVEATQNEAPKLSDPIPGYCGFNRRI